MFDAECLDEVWTGPGADGEERGGEEAQRRSKASGGADTRGSRKQTERTSNAEPESSEAQPELSEHHSAHTSPDSARSPHSSQTGGDL